MYKDITSAEFSGHMVSACYFTFKVEVIFHSRVQSLLSWLKRTFSPTGSGKFTSSLCSEVVLFSNDLLRIKEQDSSDRRSICNDYDELQTIGKAYYKVTKCDTEIILKELPLPISAFLKRIFTSELHAD